MTRIQLLAAALVVAACSGGDYTGGSAIVDELDAQPPESPVTVSPAVAAGETSVGAGWAPESPPSAGAQSSVVLPMAGGRPPAEDQGGAGQGGAGENTAGAEPTTGGQSSGGSSGAPPGGSAGEGSANGGGAGTNQGPGDPEVCEPQSPGGPLSGGQACGVSCWDEPPVGYYETDACECPNAACTCSEFPLDEREDWTWVSRGNSCISLATAAKRFVAAVAVVRDKRCYLFESPFDDWTVFVGAKSAEVGCHVVKGTGSKISVELVAPSRASWIRARPVDCGRTCD